MKNRLIFISLFSLFCLTSCFSSSNENNSQSSFDPFKDDVRNLKATYIDGDNVTSKILTYGDEFDLLNNIKIYAVGKQNVVAEIPLKTDNSDGYEVETRFNTESIGNNIPTKFNAGNYYFTFSFRDKKDYLSLNINKAELEDVTVVVPTVTYLEPLDEIYVHNLPENEEFEIKYEYLLNGVDEEYKTWEYTSEIINTIFFPNQKIKFKVSINSNNYNKKVFEEDIYVNKYSLRNQLNISTNCLEFELMPLKNNKNRTLSEYNFLLNQNLKAYYKNEEIKGVFSFTNSDEEVTTREIKKYQISFLISDNNYYLSEKYTFDVTITFTKFKIDKPHLDSYLYSFQSTYKHSPKTSFTHLEDVYDSAYYYAYYLDTSLVVLNGESYAYPGTYKCEVSLFDLENTTWIDGTTDSYIDTWTIFKGTIRFEYLYLVNTGYYDDEGVYYYQPLNGEHILRTNELVSTFKLYDYSYDDMVGLTIFKEIKGLKFTLTVLEPYQEYAHMNGYTLVIDEDAPFNSSKQLEIEMNFKFDDPYMDATPTNIDFKFQVIL